MMEIWENSKFSKKE